MILSKLRLPWTSLYSKSSIVSDVVWCAIQETVVWMWWECQCHSTPDPVDLPGCGAAWRGTAECPVVCGRGADAVRFGTGGGGDKFRELWEAFCHVRFVLLLHTNCLRHQQEDLTHVALIFYTEAFTIPKPPTLSLEWSSAYRGKWGLKARRPLKCPN